MRAVERGFLLLSSHLGIPERAPLTSVQLRNLAIRMQNLEITGEDRDLRIQDLKRLGYDDAMAARILRLLSEEEVLEHYLKWILLLTISIYTF